LVINKGNNDETHDNRISGSACALKHIRAGAKQRRQRGYVWRWFQCRRFCGNWCHPRFREREFEGKPAGLDDRYGWWHAHGSQYNEESIGEHARPFGLAQRVDIDADRARLGSQPIGTYKR
jgi:hypothetical protein